MKFRIHPLLLGTKEVRRSEAFHACTDEGVLSTAYSCFFLEGADKNIMVDTGLPQKPEQMPGGRLPSGMLNQLPLQKALLARGLDPLSVTDIVLTHLHYDHCANFDLFPNVERIYIQRTEVLEALAPIGFQASFYLPEGPGTMPAWMKGIGHFVFTDGDQMIMPGIKVYSTPGHTMGSQSVLVDTTAGQYLLTGDFVALRESFDRCIPNRILRSKTDWLCSYEKIKRLNATLLPGHDLSVHQEELYG